jgi:NAD(P)-dependent dehydrogenase (short-subunit alcohol dehydrogenase family)
MGMPGTSAYAATKGALRAFVRAAASELAQRGIRVNAISPGPIDTTILAKSGVPAERIESFRQNVATLVPLGRMGSPDEVAAAAVFLASADASYVTGTELVVDGGFVEV